MVSEALRAYAGQSSNEAAWTQLFTTHNSDHHDYLSQEKIAIKINNNNTINNCDTNHCPLPQVIVALLKTLIDDKHVPQANITPLRRIAVWLPIKPAISAIITPKLISIPAIIPRQIDQLAATPPLSHVVSDAPI